MRICLIRHGETTYNLDERMQGIRDIELTSKGLQEAKLLGKNLMEAGIFPKVIHSSPVKRALDTTNNLGFNVPISMEPAFQARSLGELEGLSKAEIRKIFPGAVEKLIEWDWVPPGAQESLRKVYIRANSRIEEIFQSDEIRPTPLLIVTHSGVLEALSRGWLEISAPEPLPFELKNACALNFERIEKLWVFMGTIKAGDGSFVDLA